jgi:hypothetical protein
MSTEFELRQLGENGATYVDPAALIAAADEINQLGTEVKALRALVELIFASTLPYNDGDPTFIDAVTDMWKELTPNVKVSGPREAGTETSAAVPRSAAP